MKMIFAVLLMGLMPQVSFAEASLDSVDKKIDKVLDNQDTIINAVENNPLKGKTMGVELNVFRALAFGVVPEEKTLSGGFSLFDVDGKVEYNFPVYYRNSKGILDNTTFSLFSADAQYRYFLGETLNGFYLSGLVRFSKLQGTLGDVFTFNTSVPTATGSETKFGAGVGIGYRIFSESGFYWGTNLTVGRFFTGKHDQFYNAVGGLDDDAEIFFDIDLLKFGYAF